MSDVVDVTQPMDGLRYEKRGAVAVVTIARPDRANSLSRTMRAPMQAIWCDINADTAVRVAIVTGEGDRHFCTGADVHEVAETGTTPAGAGPARQEIAWSALANRVWKPLICALNGLVAGGGLHFVADADIVLAADHVEVMDTHTSVGMVGAVENVGLTHRLPLGSVLRMTLMGRHYRMSAQRAHQLGLIDELYARESLMAAAMEMAERIAENSPRAVSLSKQAIWASLGRDHEGAAEYAWALARMQWAHPDFREGPRAFAQGRPPQWSP
ncbi:MAG TPA: enoyl-CoA hydratase-related protein [Candidatus Dormibacteraeota bacterium]|nr:enoyl-CoA hydratase-related protein [Candidatus Dormibacteraeota bacterium]